MVCRFFYVLAILALASLQASASASPKAITVLEQEQRWLKAIARGDSHALRGILAENFIHINYRGELLSRADTLAQVERRKPYVNHTSEQTVDFAGSIAIVHGMNT